MFVRPRMLSVVAGVIATAGALALPSSASAGFKCSADAVSGTLLGQAVPTAVSAGSATADCVADQAIESLALPTATAPLVKVGVIAASTSGDARSALAVGGIGDLRVGLPALPIPADLVPAGAGNVAIALPPQLAVLPQLANGLTLDLRPLFNVVLPNGQLPSELLAVQGAVAYAGAKCENGVPAFAGAPQVGGVRVLGNDLTSALADQTLKLLDSASIDPSNFKLDTVLAGLPTLPVVLGVVDLNPLLRQTVATQVQAYLDQLPTISIPETVARVQVSPGSQEKTANGLTQRALDVKVSVAGRSIADLRVGRATVGADSVDCSAPTPAAPAPQTAEDLALACTRRRIVLIDVLRDGDRVRLLGAADKDLAGRTVRIVFDHTGRTVARATVRRDGSFSSFAPMPAANIAGTNLARYRAVLGDEESLNLKLTRRMVVDSVRSSGGRVRITGRVIGPLTSPPELVTVKRRVTCSREETVARVRPSSTGRFSVNVKAPENQTAAVYRLQTRVLNSPGNPKRYPTFTLPRAVDLL